MRYGKPTFNAKVCRERDKGRCRYLGGPGGAAEDAMLVGQSYRQTPRRYTIELAGGRTLHVDGHWLQNLDEVPPDPPESCVLVLDAESLADLANRNAGYACVFVYRPDDSWLKHCRGQQIVVSLRGVSPRPPATVVGTVVPEAQA